MKDEFVTITAKYRVVWSLNEWQKDNDLLITRPARKPPETVKQDRRILCELLEERERRSWAWRNPA